MSNPIDDFFAGSGAVSAKFDYPGDTVTGKIVSADVRQQTDMDSGEPLFWPDGKPRNQLVLALQTSEQDSDEDDGRRSVYIRGGNMPGSTQAAVTAAIREAGADKLRLGGTLTLTLTGTQQVPGKKYQQKLYKANYAAPDKDAEIGSFLGATQPAAPAPSTPVAPVQGPPAPQVTTEQAAAFAAWQKSQAARQ